MDVSLREVTQDNLFEVLALEVAPEQRHYVREREVDRRGALRAARVVPRDRHG